MGLRGRSQRGGEPGSGQAGLEKRDDERMGVGGEMVGNPRREGGAQKGEGPTVSPAWCQPQAGRPAPKPSSSRSGPMVQGAGR